MKLLNLTLDISLSDTPAIAINPNHIISVEPDFVSTPSDEYESAIITLSDGRKFNTLEDYPTIIKKINACF